MVAVAKNPSFAKKVGIPQSVGRDFTEADKGRKFAKGGDMKNAAMKKIFAGKETPAEERKEKAAVKKAGMSYKAAEKKFEGKKYAFGVESPGLCLAFLTGPSWGFCHDKFALLIKARTLLWCYSSWCPFRLCLDCGCIRALDKHGCCLER